MGNHTVPVARVLPTLRSIFLTRKFWLLKRAGFIGTYKEFADQIGAGLFGTRFGITLSQ